MVIDITDEDEGAPSQKTQAAPTFAAQMQERQRKMRLGQQRPPAALPSVMDDERWARQVQCRQVRVMRGGESPILAFENLNFDRGVKLAEVCRLKESVRLAEEGKRINYGSRAEIDKDSGVGPTIDMKIMADRMLELARGALRHDRAATASLQRTTHPSSRARLA